MGKRLNVREHNVKASELAGWLAVMKLLLCGAIVDFLRQYVTKYQRAVFYQISYFIIDFF